MDPATNVGIKQHWQPDGMFGGGSLIIETALMLAQLEALKNFITTATSKIIAFHGLFYIKNYYRIDFFSFYEKHV